jgi:hypothetical protein
MVHAPRHWRSLRDLAAWVLAAAAALAAIGLGVDGVLLVIGGASPRQALVGAAVAAALGAVVAGALAPLLFVLAAITRQVSRRHLRWWPIPLAAAALASTLLLIDPLALAKRGYLAVAAGLSIALFALLSLGRLGDRRWAQQLGALACAAALLGDVLVPATYYQDLHDLGAVLAAAGLLVAVTPLRLHLRASRPESLVLGVAGLVLGGAIIPMGADAAAPGWRVAAARVARYEPRLERVLKRAVDLDGDGFSPIAWGGDCDDHDAAKHPLAREAVVGEDKNCNGIALPEAASDAERGLQPPMGDPDLFGTELVLLVTIDALRADLLRPEIMPRLAGYAARGVSFTRLYAAASRTHTSLPLLLRGEDRAPPVSEQLARAGIRSTAVLGYRDTRMAEITAGFDVVPLPWTSFPGAPPPPAGQPRGPIDAATLTDRALEAARAPGRRLLWVHYFGAHWPYARRTPSELHAPPPGMPKEFGAYLTEVAHIDEEVGRLLDTLRSEGRLERAVVLVTADHGEGFGQNGIKYHGVSGYDPILRVPGVLLTSGLRPGVFHGLASTRDVAATVLGAFGQVGSHPEAERFGRSWLRLIDAPAGPLHRFVVARSSAAVDSRGFVQPVAAIVEGRYKLIERFEDRLVQVYDLERDPGEAHPIELDRDGRALRRELALYRDVDGYP